MAENNMPPDDVLVMRIRSLENELTKEKAAHAMDVDDLKERLDLACEINAKLRNQSNDDEYRKNQEIVDSHIDILATLMCLYPFTPDKDLEFEFNIPTYRIRYAAEVLGAVKSPEARREAVKYLQRQHREMIERRGGDQGNHTNIKSIEMVSRNGRVVKTYRSAKTAARACGLCDKTIREYCTEYDKKRRYTRNGYTFRYKK